MYPNEIESVLQSHSAVREVAVVRIPSDIDDEHPMAFVTKVSGKEVGKYTRIMESIFLPMITLLSFIIFSILETLSKV